MYIPIELNVELIICKLCMANHVYPILYLTDKSKVSTLVMFMINTIVRSRRNLQDYTAFWIQSVLFL